MNAKERTSKGQAISDVLSGAWRSNPLPLQISEDELKRIAPLLLKSGAGALVWRRLRDSHLQTSSHVVEFHHLFRSQILKARIDQAQIEKVFKTLRSAGMEPILVKGWAIARIYPERGMRPYGDIDLCVRPEHYREAKALLNSTEGQHHQTDLHYGFATLGGMDFDEMYERSHLVKLGETKVRVLDPEEHLLVLCFHMLREGAWRPLWLCDVAAALESRPENFNWDRCIAGSEQNRRILACALGLAHELLDANIQESPFASSDEQLPPWVIPTVLNEWASPLPSMPRRHAAPLATHIRRPLRFSAAIADRWPNPIEATVVLGAPFDKRPRIPLQVGAYLMRAAGFFRRALGGQPV